MMSKRGQGLSLNVIIIAALALIVLVVLAAIFVQQTGLFNKRLSEQANIELTNYKANYGECHPNRAVETKFTGAFSKAETPEDEESAREEFRDIIRACSSLGSLAECEADSNCNWQ